MGREWNYGNAYLRYPIEKDCEIRFQNGSALIARDIFSELPQFMYEAEVIFTDSPWSMGNMRSFYTKAGIEPPNIHSFKTFYRRLFDCIGKIAPSLCFLEIGKDFLADYIIEMRKIYKYVTFYNSTYYHKAGNWCYVVQGSRKRCNYRYDGIDEEDIINKVAAIDGYTTIGDLCMGRGLVACAATRHGRKFVGTELNLKRLAVCLERLDALGVRRCE